MADLTPRVRRMARNPGPSPSLHDVLSFVPGVGDAIAAYDTANALRQRDYAGAALSALGVLPFVPGIVTSGIRKGRPFWHGTNETLAPQIAREGFTKGESAELHIPGTSLAYNPEVSYYKFASSTPEGMLMVRVPKDAPVTNLKPSEYLSTFLDDGRSLAEAKSHSFVGIPRSYFDESELFVPAAMRGHLSVDHPAGVAGMASHTERRRRVWKANPWANNVRARSAFPELTNFMRTNRSDLAAELLHRGPSSVVATELYRLKQGLPKQKQHLVDQLVDAFGEHSRSLRDMRKAASNLDAAYPVVSTKPKRRALDVRPDIAQYHRRQYDEAYKRHRAAINKLMEARDRLMRELPKSFITRATRGY